MKNEFAFDQDAMEVVINDTFRISAALFFCTICGLDAFPDGYGQVEDNEIELSSYYPSADYEEENLITKAVPFSAAWEDINPKAWDKIDSYNWIALIFPEEIYYANGHYTEVFCFEKPEFNEVTKNIQYKTPGNSIRNCNSIYVPFDGNKLESLGMYFESEKEATLQLIYKLNTCVGMLAKKLSEFE